MIGRKEELAQLNALYESDRFEFLVLYGRRRVGKTTILQEFAKTHPAIFYAAQEKNDALNLADFSRSVQQYFGGRYIAPFADWEMVISYISDRAEYRRSEEGKTDYIHSGGSGRNLPDSTTPEKSHKTVLIIDEFPFIARQNPSIKSILQHAIDHVWKDRNILLILCGSSASFMLNDVMGYESPLYGRATAVREVLPFDYFEASDFYPMYTAEEKLLAYGILGGIPRYLEEFSDRTSIKINLSDRVLRTSSFLNDEPSVMLRMELRETGIYSSILEAISHGYNRIHTIADHIHEESAKVAKYLKTLTTLRIVSRQLPCGDPSGEKKAVYAIRDNYFRFWYRYVFSYRSYYELLGPEDAAGQVMKDIDNYMGPAFEEICIQYLKRQAKLRRLPFVPFQIGRWWGTNPAIRAQDDIDILAISKDGDEAIFCECKYRNRRMPMEEYDDLMTSSKAFPKVLHRHYMFFSKGGYTKPVMERAQKEQVKLLTVKDLFSM